MQCVLNVDQYLLVFFTHFVIKFEYLRLFKRLCVWVDQCNLRAFLYVVNFLFLKLKKRVFLNSFVNFNFGEIVLK